MKYPNAKKPYQKTTSLANLGMDLEGDIDETNKYYLNNNIAIIHKKPTPIQVVKVSYPARNKAKITEAYYKIPSTTDYNGIYQGRYIDFDVKETKSKTALPLANIHPHQIKHLASVNAHGGIAFLVINFKPYNEYYLLLIEDIMPIWQTKNLPNGRKSLPYNYVKEKGHKISFGYAPRLDYLSVLNQILTNA